MNPIARSALKLRNLAAVSIYRASRARLGGKSVGLPVLLLTVRGRSTGKPRTTPLIYLAHEDSYVVVGSAFGAMADPDWIRNLAAARSAQIRVGDREWQVSARVTAGEERERLWQDVVTPALPKIAGYEAKSGRKFPICVLDR